MISLAVILSWFVLVTAICQLFFAWIYSRVLHRGIFSEGSWVSKWQPKAAVIVAIRGSDPCLFDNLSRLLVQKYSDYTMFIILDSQQDEAWDEVQRFARLGAGRVRVQILDDLPSRCSLKCASLAQAIENLDSSFEVVAFIDTDAPAHSTWLSELVAPLENDSVGVTTGNRWYTPESANWGSLVRYLWNAGAVVQVWLNGIIWAGSMAMRRDFLLNTGIVEQWKKNLSVDGAVVQRLRAVKSKPVFVPTVIMPNEEDTSIGDFVLWSKRQIVAAHSSGASWVLVLLHVCSLAFCSFAPPVLILIGMAMANVQVVLLGCAVYLFYWSTAVVSALLIEFQMQKILRKNGNPKSEMRWTRLLKLWPAVILTHWVYFAAFAKAMFSTCVSWRGVEYKLLPEGGVVMGSYQPFRKSRKRKDLESVI